MKYKNLINNIDTRIDPWPKQFDIMNVIGNVFR